MFSTAQRRKIRLQSTMFSTANKEEKYGLESTMFSTANEEENMIRINISTANK